MADANPPAAEGAKPPAPGTAEKKAEPTKSDKAAAKPKPSPSVPRTRPVTEVLNAVSSKDQPTRRMGWFFWLCFGGFFTISVTTFWHYRAVKELRLKLEEQARKDAESLGEFLQKTNDNAKRMESGLELGTFQFELKPTQGLEPSRNAVDTAEVEIFVQCDNAATRAYLEASVPQLRNEILLALGPLERETVLSKTGKQRMKKTVIDHLNAWLHEAKHVEGKIEDLYFTNVILN
jgi:flagellar basal body-associated protein FliL